MNNFNPNIRLSIACTAVMPMGVSEWNELHDGFESLKRVVAGEGSLVEQARVESLGASKGQLAYLSQATDTTEFVSRLVETLTRKGIAELLTDEGGLKDVKNVVVKVL